MAKFGVRPEKEIGLFSRMKELGIHEEDIQETFIRSGGSGGQNVNKTSTCVQIKHVPTGIIVKSQKGRTQGLNRFLARRILLSRIEESLLGNKSSKVQKMEKTRKQKKRRKRRTNKKLEI
ncbi:peptide chain release factor-like protein [Desulfobacterota bacterium AH_259_B03_O07]|nr:peptide chain release factor-like protein [Desulfobacterota bacterium AH_259_B03_O07]